jgi:membrane fusion protein (multidrug efflux system)
MKKKNLLFCKTAISILIMMAVSCRQNPASQTEENVYRAMEIGLSNQTLQSTFSASIRGKLDIDIFPQVSGYITQLFIDEGSTVHKGQTLFIIDRVPFEAALRTATANVTAARAQVATAQLVYDSKKELMEKDVISHFDLQNAENALATAKAHLEQALAQEVNAKNNLSYTTVKSPSNGLVGTLPFKEGALVSPAQPRPLTKVSDNSEMYVYFSMTENKLLSLIRQYGSVEKVIKSMPPVQLQLSDQSVYPESGRIETISGVIEPGVGAVSVKSVFPNKHGLLRSGGSGNVLIPQERTNCIVIPKSATFEVQDKIYVYRFVDGVAKSTRIEIDPVSNNEEYIILNGLNSGDKIIIEGVGFIRDNTSVQIK